VKRKALKYEAIRIITHIRKLQGKLTLVQEELQKGCKRCQGYVGTYHNCGLDVDGFAKAMLHE
jgi:hypothetical protein